MPYNDHVTVHWMMPSPWHHLVTNYLKSVTKAVFPAEKFHGIIKNWLKFSQKCIKNLKILLATDHTHFMSPVGSAGGSQCEKKSIKNDQS